MMNERIDELIGYAKFMAEETTKRQISLNTELRTFSKFFAELIVNHAVECVRDVLRDEQSELTYTAGSEVQKRLREYFGVEE